jgi:membrane-anchored protein YejM (alkaline phosphatase superfamily)
MKIVSGVLILITVYLNAKHGWAGISNTMSPAEVKMMTDIGIEKNWFLPIGIVSFAVCLLVLFPQTFFIGNVINAMLIVLIMALALKAGVTKTALIEIPFFLMPLVMIYLGHPFKK